MQIRTSLQFFGYAKSFQKVDDFDKTNATVCMIMYIPETAYRYLLYSSKYPFQFYISKK